MKRSVAVAVLTLVVASSLLAGATAGTPTDRPVLAQPEGFDETTFDVTVYDNQSARWTFEHRRALDNGTQVDRFEAFARDFEGNETDLYASFVDRSRALVAYGDDATGRNMTATDHARSASVERLTQRQGVVRLSFTWTDFAVDSRDRVVVGDVFEGGLPIGADQRLVVHPGPDLAFAAAQPDDYEAAAENLSASDSITWFGERRFADERPRVEFLAAGTGGTAASTGSSTVMFVGLLLIVAVVVAGVAYQRGAFDSLPVGDDGDTAAETGGDASPSPPEPEVVSDRDRVKTLLSENGGRMKQVRIVDQTDWSKSKVSMLLSEMEEDGEISKLRVGRENIVSLSGHEPDAAGSPFDEE